VEVGSVIGMAWMVETAYGVNGCDQRMQSDCVQRTMITVFPMFLGKCHTNKIISKDRKAEKKLGC
jgi:hypothetical protein